MAVEIGKLVDKFQCNVHKSSSSHIYCFLLYVDEKFMFISWSSIISPGSVELAAVGVSISVFNLVSKLFNVPLLNVTTSFVAEQQAMDANYSGVGEGKQVGSSICVVKGSSLVCVSLITVIVFT
jgi:hypothetical protein